MFVQYFLTNKLMIMKKSFLNLMLLPMLVMLTFLASCNKDTSDYDLEEEILGIRTDELLVEDLIFSFADLEQIPYDGIDAEAMKPPRPGKCFKLNYPVTIEFPDETTVTVNDREEMVNAIRDWRQANPDVLGRPNLVFAVDITMRDGTIITVNSKEEMRQIIINCAKKWRHVRLWRCLDLVFPVTVILPDESTIEVNSKEELKTVLQNWRVNNSDVEGFPRIQFPFDVKLKNGRIITINNIQDLRRHLRKCIRDKRFN